MFDPRSINREHPLPLYAQVKQALLASISRGDFRVGELLPGENELVRELGVSQITIRRALKDLVEAGYIVRKPGLGTLVVRRKINHLSGRIGGVTDDLESQGFHVHSRMLQHGRTRPTPAVAAKLQVAPQARVLRDLRLVLANGEPFGLIESHHNIPNSIEFTEAEIQGDFILRVLKERHKIPFQRATRTMEAVAATPEEASLLSVAAGEPLLRAELLAFGVGDKPVSHVAALYRGDRYRYYQDYDVEP